MFGKEESGIGLLKAGVGELREIWRWLVKVSCPLCLDIDNVKRVLLNCLESKMSGGGGSLMGGLQAKSMASQRYRAVTRWRICVTMATLWQQQAGGYALLFYIFNSTVIDWTCFIFFFFCLWKWLDIGEKLAYRRIIPEIKDKLDMWGGVWTKWAVTGLVK